MYGHVITQFSRIGSLPHFFTHGAPLLKSDRINVFFFIRKCMAVLPGRKKVAIIPR